MGHDRISDPYREENRDLGSRQRRWRRFPWGVFVLKKRRLFVNNLFESCEVHGEGDGKDYSKTQNGTTVSLTGPSVRCVPRKEGAAEEVTLSILTELCLQLAHTKTSFCSSYSKFHNGRRFLAPLVYPFV